MISDSSKLGNPRSPPVPMYLPSHTIQGVLLSHGCSCQDVSQSEPVFSCYGPIWTIKINIFGCVPKICVLYCCPHLHKMDRLALSPKTGKLTCPGLLTPSSFFTLHVIHKSYDGYETLCYLLRPRPPGPIFLTSPPLHSSCGGPLGISAAHQICIAFQPCVDFSSPTCIAPPQSSWLI